MQKVAKDAKLQRGSSALTATHLRPNLQVAVLRGVARQLLRRLTFPELEDVDEGPGD